MASARDPHKSAAEPHHETKTRRTLKTTRPNPLTLLLTFVPAIGVAASPTPIDRIGVPDRAVVLRPEPGAGSAADAPQVLAVTPDTRGWVTGLEGLTGCTVDFTEDVQVVESDLLVLNSADIPLPFEFTYDPFAHRLEITLDTPVQMDRVRLILKSTIADVFGNPLDGEITNPADPSFPSGNNAAGGQAVFYWTVLAGDADRDGMVGKSDAALIFAGFGLQTGDPGFNPDTDLNNDGVINILDVAAWSFSEGDSLNPTDGEAPVLTLTSPSPAQGFEEGVNEFFVEVSEPLLTAALSTDSIAVIDQSGVLADVSAVQIVSPNLYGFILNEPLDTENTYRVTFSNALTDFSAELLTVPGTLTLVRATEPSIFPPRSFPVGVGPRFAAAGDFNSDGLVDYLVSNTGEDTLSLLRGVGDGTFTTTAVIATGPTPRGIAVGDFDDDGALDAAIAIEGGDQLLVLFGDGAGTLGNTPADVVLVPVGDAPVAVDALALDAGPTPDLAVVCRDSANVFILLSQTDRSFTLAQTVPAGMVPVSAVMGDFVAGPLPDLAVADNAADAVLIFEGLGDGLFDPGSRSFTSIPTGPGPVFVDAGDLDNDKDLDLFTANSSGGSVTVARRLPPNRGITGFETASIPAGDGTIYVDAGDLDNDKDLDLATADSEADTITPIEQDPVGTFTPKPPLDSGNNPVFVDITDVNGDGIPDLVSLLSRDEIRAGALTVRLGDPVTGFAGQDQFATVPMPRALAVADFGVGSALDLFIAGSNGQVLFGDGLGDFSLQGGEIMLPGSASRVAVGDADADGSIDLLVSVDFPAPATYFFEGEGEDTFNEPFVIGTFSIALAFADLNPYSQGQEFVTTGFGKSGQTINVLGFNGSFTFFVTEIFLDGGVVLDFAVEDMNDDGFPDIVALGIGGVFTTTPARGEADEAGVAVFLAEDLGESVAFEFAARGDVVPGFDATELAVGDVDGDFIPDVVVVSNLLFGNRGVTQTGRLSVLTRDDKLFFSSPIVIQTPDFLGGIAIADFDGDQLGDIVVSNTFADDVSVYLSEGNGDFAPPQRFETHVGPTTVIADHFDDNPSIDLVILNAGSNDITVLLGTQDAETGR